MLSSLDRIQANGPPKIPPSVKVSTTARIHTVISAAAPMRYVKLVTNMMCGIDCVALTVLRLENVLLVPPGTSRLRVAGFTSCCSNGTTEHPLIESSQDTICRIVPGQVPGQSKAEVFPDLRYWLGKMSRFSTGTGLQPQTASSQSS